MTTEQGSMASGLAAIFHGLESAHCPAPEAHHGLIDTEMGCGESFESMVRVVSTMGAGADLSRVDWTEAASLVDLEQFPAYYRMPFHSVPGGWLNENAALGDRAAMQAIYADAHPEQCLGLREELAKLVPADAEKVVDFGSGTGDGAAAVARRLPNAEVLAFEASPFMIAAAQIQNETLSNLRHVQGFAEASGLDASSVDAITITLVLHECPDRVKDEILCEVARVLRPGGTLVLTDTANDNLDDFRGFYEPYREQWRSFDPDDALRGAGLEVLAASEPSATLWSRVAVKPA